jgi:hypothetical protein
LQSGFAVFVVGEKEDKVKTFNQNNLLFLTKPGGSLVFGDKTRDAASSSCLLKLPKKFYAMVPFVALKGDTPGVFL